MSYTCACWRCSGKAWNDGTVHGGAAVWAPDTTTWGPGASSCNVDHGGRPCPDPLRPPETDEEPWAIPIGADDDEDTGLWLGALLLLAALVIGVVIGRLTA